MIEPEAHPDESARLASLYATGLLDDTGDTARFDRITRLAQRLFDVPIALVTLVDAEHQHFKSVQGLDADGTPRSVSFCGHAVAADERLVVEDASIDARFADNPLVVGDPNIRFYAGEPIHSSDGFPLGTVCIIDDQPRKISDEELADLADLAALVEGEILTSALAMIDELTGLLNRRGLLMVANRVFSHAQRAGEAMAVVMADLDGLKVINDELGHAEGDDALRAAAEVLRESFRASDTVARLGGDEFAVAMVDTDLAAVGDALARVQSIMTNSESIHFGMSVGSAVWPSDEAGSLEDLLELADQRMYVDKEARREQTG